MEKIEIEREKLIKETFELLKRSNNLNRRILKDLKFNFWLSLLLHFTLFLLGMYWGITLWC